MRKPRLRPGSLTRSRKQLSHMEPRDVRDAIKEAISHLHAARDLLRDVAPLSCNKVRLALTSAQGAQRHAQNLEARLERQDRYGGCLDPKGSGERS